MNNIIWNIVIFILGIFIGLIWMGASEVANGVNKKELFFLQKKDIEYIQYETKEGYCYEYDGETEKIINKK